MASYVEIGSSILVVFCLISYGTAELDNIPVGCSLAKLPDNRNISCSDIDLKPISTEHTLIVPESTYCTLKCGDTFSRNAFAYCLGSRWTGTISECGKKLKETYQQERNAVDTDGNPLQEQKRTKRWWCWWWCRPRPRDRTPPSLSCPPSQTVTAGYRHNRARAYWTTPTAYDSKDGYVAVRRLYRNTYPGYWFWEGTTLVGYYAKDRAGNMATCYFHITVRVTRCRRSSWIQNGYASCYPYDMRYGTYCKFYCSKGHEIQGNQYTACNRYGNWNYRQPTCEKVQCPPLQPANKMSISCTNGNKFRSVCTMTCGGGYDIPRGVHRIRVCQHDKTWTGVDTECEDIEAPRFTNCQASLTFYIPKYEERSTVYWNDPEVEDNSGFTVTSTQYEGPGSRSVLPVGIYTAKYTAQDRNGNRAKDCQFKIVVKQIRCHNLHATPYTDVKCTGTRYGSTCKFTCSEGAILEGHHTVECQRQGDPPYGYWDWGSGQPYCKLLDKCPALTAPVHGALACDTWLGGRYCQMMCQSGYTVNKGRSFPKMMVCNNDGIWDPQVQQCGTKLTKTQSARVVAKFQFEHFDGDCSTEETKQKIKLQFIKILEKSNFAAHCQQNDGCLWQNVKVKCGKTERKKRESESYGTGYRYRRGTSDMTIEMEVEYETEDGVDADSYKQIHENNTNNMKTLTDDINNGTLVLSFDNTTVTPVMETTGLDLDCVNNTIPSLSTYSCLECSNGSYVDVIKKECVDCPIGTYQPSAGQSECITCPAQTSTSATGSTSSAQCIDACPPGSFSENTVLPCTPCDVGSYQSKYGSTDCTQCTGSKITLNDQSTLADDCKEFDIVFPKNQSLGVALPLETPRVLREFTLTCRFQCDGQCYGNVLKMNEQDGILLGLEFERHAILHALGYEYKTTLEVPNDEEWHSFTFTKTETQLSVNIDSRTTFNHSIPTELDFNITSLTIGENFTGAFSQLNVFSNQSTVTDFDQVASKCSNAIAGNIVPWREFREATLYNAFLQLPSQCDDFDDCSSSPCINGSCIDELSSYKCSCDFGYTGNDCEVNIDDCAVNGCQNEASCVDEIGNYTCKCPDLFIGEFCEIEQVNGEWGSWGNWTSCSVTCGNGTMTRSRECDDPAPDNGGLECQGNNTDVTECSTEECRVCTVLKEPENADLVCTETDEMSRCTLTCHPGYEFDIAPPDLYTCGNETGNMWDFKTDDNADTKLPSCSPTEPGEKIKFMHSISYYNLTCSEGANHKETIRNKVDTVSQNLTCIKNTTCTKENIAVFNCGSHRKKRDTLAAGFTITLGCEPIVVGTKTCYDTLTYADQELKEYEGLGYFTITIDGVAYLIDLNSTFYDDDLTCPAGAVSVQGYCVPCSPGHYFSNDECELCDRDTYQDEYKQTTCKACPTNTKTPGTGSANITDCIQTPGTKVEPENPTKEEENTAIGITIGAGVAAIVCSIVLIIVTICLCKKKSTNKAKISDSHVTLSGGVVDAWRGYTKTQDKSQVFVVEDSDTYDVKETGFINSISPDDKEYAKSVPPISTSIPSHIPSGDHIPKENDLVIEDVEFTT